ncbi:MAG: dTDP-4-dehydrorhamnose reductase [Candidatus Aureabacteria bacterium]|nr:dTDP-4-dehydrorhamnose reductase [Candidatus Auribacterota bacterium]
MNRKKSVIIIGANGQLGYDLKQVFADWKVVSLNGPPEKDIDIRDEESIKKAFQKTKADFVINTAAFTDVPKCEEVKEFAYQVNSLGAKNVARACREKGFALIHISSDYVFDGKKHSPYTEDDGPHPLNHYGFTKLEAERLIRKETDSYYILRTSGLYGKAGCLVKGENFVDKMLRYAEEKQDIRVVDDEILTPTSSLQLAKQIRRICEERPDPGIYHATNQGQCSWYEFAKEIFHLTGKKVVLTAVHQKDFPSQVLRPLYSVLENRNLNIRDLDVMDDWHDALKEYLEQKGLLRKHLL